MHESNCRRNAKAPCNEFSIKILLLKLTKTWRILACRCQYYLFYPKTTTGGLNYHTMLRMFDCLSACMYITRWYRCGAVCKISKQLCNWNGCYERTRFHGLTLIPAWISNCIHYKVWDQMTYPFPNFNGATVEVWEWKSYFIPRFTGHVITYPWCDWSWFV